MRKILITLAISTLVGQAMAQTTVKTKLTEFAHNYQTSTSSLSCKVIIIPGFGPFFHHEKTVELKINKINYYYHPSIYKLNSSFKNTFLTENDGAQRLNCDDIEKLKDTATDNTLTIKSKLSTFLEKTYYQNTNECHVKVAEYLVTELENGTVLKANHWEEAGRYSGKCP